jgi:beta-phosphoglucomutase
MALACNGRIGIRSCPLFPLAVWGERAGVVSDQVRAILFDFDGVLVDSEPVRFRAGAEALETIGVSLSWEAFVRHWAGRMDEAALRDILGARFETDGSEVIARRNVAYEERLAEVLFFPDAIRLLGRLPSGFPLAIASGSRRTEVAAILARLDLSHRFHALVTAGGYARSKPAPDPFLAAASVLKVPAEACLVVEDSPAGVAAGRAAGMAVLAVDRRGSGAALGESRWRVESLDVVDITATGEVIVNPFSSLPEDHP